MASSHIEEYLNEYNSKAGKNRIPLVLFSGGYDSTLLLLKTLEYTSVDILYVKGWQAGLKQLLEMRQRERIIKLVNARTSDYCIRNSYVVKTPFPNSAVAKKGLYFAGLHQPVEWLTCAFIAYDPREHNSLLYGAIEGDDALAHRLEIERMWHSMVSIRYRYEISTIEMPLNNLSKIQYFYIMRA